jgi:hypothetical protein
MSSAEATSGKPLVIRLWRFGKIGRRRNEGWSSTVRLVGTARCTVRAAYQRRNSRAICAPLVIYSTRCCAGGDIAARCPHLGRCAPKHKLTALDTTAKNPWSRPGEQSGSEGMNAISFGARDAR